jgi:hypothetical protein
MNLTKLICDLTLPCADNGCYFHRKERIIRLREWLAPSAYVCLPDKPLALVWRHRDFDPSQPMLLVSSHIDSLYTHYHASCSDGILLGTFDNSITNAIVIDRMLGGHLHPQVLVAFTGDEEDSSRGADHVMQLLQSCGPLHPEFVVVLDVTEEAYDTHAFTVENLFRNKSESSAACLRFSRIREIISLCQSILAPADVYIITEGDPDESWQYDEHDLNCCAFCLPIQTITGDMHDDDGVYARCTSVTSYAAALTTLLTGLIDHISQISKGMNEPPGLEVTDPLS